MPFVDPTPDTTLVSDAAPVEPKVQPGLLPTLGAAFRQDNEVVSVYRRLQDEAFPPDPNYNPLPDIKGTPYFHTHADAFVGSHSAAETEAIKRRIDEEEADHKTLDAAGMSGTVAQLAAGILNPTTWLVPVGGEAVAAARAGLAARRVGAAARMGVGFGAGAAASEAILQDTHETRTMAESLTTVATATLLGALLGPLTVARMSPAERVAAENMLHADRIAMAEHAGNTEAADALRKAAPEAPEAGFKPTADWQPVPKDAVLPPALEIRMDMEGGQNFARLPPEAAGTGAAQAAGAAAAETRDVKPVRTILGGSLDRFDPMSRLLGQESPAARRAAVDLAETPLLMEQNLKGVATTAGPAIDRTARLVRNQAEVAAHDEVNRLFAEYRFGDASTTFPRLRAQMEAFQGRDTGYMTFEQFDAEIAKAMRRNDQHEIPQVQQAAQMLRQHYDTWKQRAVDAGFFPEDVKPAGADSYLNRVYNKDAIAAKRNDFVDRVTEYFRTDQAAKRVAQDRLAGHHAMLQEWDKRTANWQARLERLTAAQDKVAARLDERAMEVRRAEKRAGVVNERATTIAEDLSDIEDFIGAMRQEVRDPALLARLDAMEAEAKQLRAADRPVTEAGLRKIEDEELKSILTGPTRMAAQMITGQRALPKAPSFVSWLVANGGLKDTTGDISHIIGGSRSRPGLLNERGFTLDEIAERIKEEAPGHFQHGLPSHRDVLEWLDEALRGRQPGWWIESRSQEAKSTIEAAKLAAALEETFHRAGIDIKSTRDVARVFRDERVGTGRVTLEDLDRIAADMEAAGESIPLGLRRAHVQEKIDVDRATIQELRGLISRAINAREAKAQRLQVAEARGSEAAVAENANRGRLGVLQDRLDRAEMRRELIGDAIEMASKQRDELRGKIEEIIGAWDGRSTSEAKAALRAREKYAASADRPEGAPRLESADPAIDSTVRRILQSDRNLSDAELRARAEETADRILSSPDGRLAYDEYRGGPQAGGRAGGEPARGPLAARTFAIPDAEIEDFLEPSALHAHRAYLRTIVPDVLLTERFGDTAMSETFRKINEEYASLAAQATSEKARTALEKQRQKAIDDLSAVRDRIRGVYGFSADLPMRNAARVANAVKSYNVISLMGMSAVSSLPDMAGQVFRHGFAASISDAWVPFARYMTGSSDVWKQAAKQYRAMGIATEMFSATRMHALSDITEMYRPGSRAERALSWGADKFQMVSMLAPWTDWAKVNASMVAGSEILRATKAAAEGKATARQMRQLAEANIEPAMATRIWNAFERGGEVRDGVHLPNTGEWADANARLAFEGAVAREADIAVVTPGQEKPLWLSTPVLSLIGQFKSFTAAATQRVLLANLQRADAQTLQGLVFSVGLGMLSYKLNAVSSGRPTSERPQDWIKEGMDRGGVLGWINEGNNLAAKASRGNVDIYRLIGANKPLSRYASRSVLDQLVGPTAGKVEALTRTMGAAASNDWKHSDTTALRRLTAMQNVFYLRRLFDQVEAAGNRQFGIEAAPAR